MFFYHFWPCSHGGLFESLAMACWSFCYKIQVWQIMTIINLRIINFILLGSSSTLWRLPADFACFAITTWWSQFGAPYFQTKQNIPSSQERSEGSTVVEFAGFVVSFSKGHVSKWTIQLFGPTDFRWFLSYWCVFFFYSACWGKQLIEIVCVESLWGTVAHVASGV